MTVDTFEVRSFPSRFSRSLKHPRISLLILIFRPSIGFKIGRSVLETRRMQQFKIFTPAKNILRPTILQRRGARGKSRREKDFRSCSRSHPSLSVTSETERARATSTLRFLPLFIRIPEAGARAWLMAWWILRYTDNGFPFGNQRDWSSVAGWFSPLNFSPDKSAGAATFPAEERDE